MTSHGTRRLYNAGCRCDDCQDWFTLYNFGSQMLAHRQAQRAERRKQGQKTGPVPVALHEPSAYSIELHRAAGEELCNGCRRLLRNFS